MGVCASCLGLNRREIHDVCICGSEPNSDKDHVAAVSHDAADQSHHHFPSLEEDTNSPDL